MNPLGSAPQYVAPQIATPSASSAKQPKKSKRRFKEEVESESGVSKKTIVVSTSGSAQAVAKESQGLSQPTQPLDYSDEPMPSYEYTNQTFRIADLVQIILSFSLSSLKEFHKFGHISKGFYGIIRRPSFLPVLNKALLSNNRVDLVHSFALQFGLISVSLPCAPIPIAASPQPVDPSTSFDLLSIPVEKRALLRNVTITSNLALPIKTLKVIRDKFPNVVQFEFIHDVSTNNNPITDRHALLFSQQFQQTWKHLKVLGNFDFFTEQSLVSMSESSLITTFETLCVRRGDQSQFTWLRVNGLAALTKFSKLRSLELPHLNDSQVTVLVNSTAICCLEEWVINNRKPKDEDLPLEYRLTKDGITQIASSPNLVNLKKLTLESCEYIANETLPLLSCAQFKLRELNILWCNNVINDNAAAVLAMNPQFSDLHILKLHSYVVNNPIDVLVPMEDVDVRVTVPDEGKKCGNHLTEMGVHHLTAQKSVLKKITDLTISLYPVTEKAYSYLAKWERIRSIPLIWISTIIHPADPAVVSNSVLNVPAIKHPFLKNRIGFQSQGPVS